MKYTVTKILLVLVLASCLLFGAVGAAFAEEAQQTELNQLLSDVQALMVKYGPEISQEVLDGTKEGTMRYYKPGAKGYCVAIGENSTMGADSYFALLMKDLGFTGKNLAKKDLLLEQVSEKILAANAAEIKKADLITLNFSVNGFARMAINEVLDKSGTYLDWSKYVPAEGVAEIKDTLVRLKACMIASGVSGNIPTLGSKADALVTAAESFAFGTLAYANTLPQVLDEIHTLNPNARIVVVGMDNPLAGTSINLSSGEAMEMGNYLGKLIQMTDDCAQAAALERQYVTFVSAPDAANANDGATISENKLITDYLRAVKDDAMPNAEGHAYINERIQFSFRKMGDVDGNGSLSYNDALMALRASIWLEDLDADAIFVADVDGKAGLSYNDALKLLRASIGLDTLD